MLFRLLLPLFLLALWTVPAQAQDGLPPTSAPTQGGTLEITELSVEGVSDESTRDFILRQSGLSTGQELTLPGDQAIANAIRALYGTGRFEDVEIVEEGRTDGGVHLAIHVTEGPRLEDYSFVNIRDRDAEELRSEVPLLRGQRVDEGRIERSKQVIRDYFRDEGYYQTDIEVERTENDDGTVNLAFNIDPGSRVRVGEIVIRGNENLSDGTLRGAMDDTRQKSWWRFWRRARFDQEAYEEDLERIIERYNERGYYDARIEDDSVYVRDGEDAELVVDITVHEGARYHIRNVTWEGNTVYNDETLTETLGFDEGDPYNATQLQERLYQSPRGNDIAGLYTNRGYMTFNAEPSIRVVEGDSLDLHFDVFEGEVYEFGNINITGNEKTREHVIRRELYTIPGQRFSRDAVQESVRRLSQLEYFEQEALSGGPELNLNEEEQTVDLTYDVEETGSDQLELSGTYGRFGLILQLRFGFNNFSARDMFDPGAWRPIPSGDGQKVSLGIQTNGTYYQNYSLSFEEPWFRGRPNPIGFSLAHSRMTDYPFAGDPTIQDDGRFIRTSANVFSERRLSWPDDRFSYSIGGQYQFFNNSVMPTLPEGISQELTIQQHLSRNSLDNPMFPTSGSRLRLSLDVAPPIGDFIQYHKWGLRSEWHASVLPDVTLSLGSNMGYIGSLTGEDVQFQRYIVGGSPFDAQQGIADFGREIIYMRGYPRMSIGPQVDGEPVGGRILNKYTSELRWLAVQSPQLQAAPYLFLDAANTWDGFDTYDPTELHRSAGVGLRLFLPILGMMEITYGYNFDTFAPVGRETDGARGWRFQFTLGEGFGFMD